MMKILMVTPYLPSPDYSGGQTRSFHLLKNLSKKCEITLFCFTLPNQKKTSKEAVEKYCRKVITIPRTKTWRLEKILFTGFSPYPFLISNYFSFKLKKLIKKELSQENYDLLHIECFYLMPNIPKTDLPILLVDQTLEFAVYDHFVRNLPKKFFLIKPLLAIDVFKLRSWEVYFWKKADKLVAVSEEDRVVMENLSGRGVEVVANGVDEALLKRRRLPLFKDPTILFGVANFKWMQNKEGALNLLKYVWPKIKNKVKNCRLIIVGRHSKSFIRSSGIKVGKGVLVTEADSVEKFYRRSFCLVAPMKSGGGSRTKFFEAMACGLPIVTTEEGIEGIAAVSGKEVLIGKSFEELADLATLILRDFSLRKRIGENARKLVKRKYGWKLSSEKLYSLYKEMKNEK